MSIHGLLRMAKRMIKRKKNPEPNPKRRLGEYQKRFQLLLETLRQLHDAWIFFALWPSPASALKIEDAGSHSRAPLLIRHVQGSWCECWFVQGGWAQPLDCNVERILDAYGSRPCLCFALFLTLCCNYRARTAVPNREGQQNPRWCWFPSLHNSILRDIKDDVHLVQFCIHVS